MRAYRSRGPSEVDLGELGDCFFDCAVDDHGGAVGVGL